MAIVVIASDSYGSIVVDLGPRQVIYFLSDTQRETSMAWLRNNPQIKIICRDRGPGYGAAACEAAPQARQLARLFENASEANLAVVRSKIPTLRRALAPSGPSNPATLARAERIRWDGAEVREVFNRRVEDLTAQGEPIKAVARVTGVSSQTIRKVLRAQRLETFRCRRNSFDACCGKSDGAALWRRLKASGFLGSLQRRARSCCSILTRLMQRRTAHWTKSSTWKNSNPPCPW